MIDREVSYQSCGGASMRIRLLAGVSVASPSMRLSGKDFFEALHERPPLLRRELIEVELSPFDGG